MADVTAGPLGEAAARWAGALGRWAIPKEILAAAPASPHGFPVDVFARAADEAPSRDTPSRQRALEALGDGGSVLDVGCGAGAAGLALVPRARRLVGVDESDSMLEAFAERASAAGAEHVEVPGRWPDVVSEVEACDVVVCHHVFYNVGDLDGFAAALDAHARKRVVVELTAAHPLAWMNPLWVRLHGLERPQEPTVEDAIAVLRELGVEPSVEPWETPFRLAEADPEQRVAFVRKRLCLGPDRDEDIAAALERAPMPSSRELVTLWWDRR